jgi:hypothetical protein
MASTSKEKNDSKVKKKQQQQILTQSDNILFK